MARTAKIELEPHYVDKYPKYPLAPGQEALRESVLASPAAFVVFSRQIGKTNALSSIFWERVINEGRAGDHYFCLSQRQSGLYEFWVDDILLEPFGGSASSDINNIWIKPPKWWKKEISKAWNKNPKLKQNWLAKGIAKEDLSYVKLLRDELSGRGGKKAQEFEGTLFNGAKITLGSAGVGAHLENKIRGKKIAGVYGEEIAQWHTNPFAALLPAIVSQGGWFMAAGTPKKLQEKNWFYNEIVEKVRNSKQAKLTNVCGIEFYTKETPIRKPKSADDIDEAGFYDDDSSSVEEVTSITLAVGDIEKVFPYFHDGFNRFAQIQARREWLYEAKPVMKNGKPEYDNVNEYTDPHGKLHQHFKYNVVKTNIEGSGLYSDADYNREYRVQFDADLTKVFDSFNPDIHIISGDNFNPDYYSTMAGFDYGTLKNNVQQIVGAENDSKKISATAYVKVALVPHGQEYQYVIYEEGYVEDPTAMGVSNALLDLVEDGCVVSLENQMYADKGITGGTYIDELIAVEPSLRRAFNRQIFPCYKRTKKRRFSDLNKWLQQQKVYPAVKESPEFEHPNIKKHGVFGRRLMITDNCPHLVRLFKDWDYILNSSGDVVTRKVRDDLYDCVCYAIDLFEYRQVRKLDKKINRAFRKAAAPENNVSSGPKLTQLFGKKGGNKGNGGRRF